MTSAPAGKKHEWERVIRLNQVITTQAHRKSDKDGGNIFIVGAN
jgi:hypothetical protein